MAGGFTGKVVLITGGGSGIGRATALAFAQEGATVVVAGRRHTSIDETVRLVESSGGQGSAVLADVSSPADVIRLVSTTVQRHGGLDIAFNNAGVFVRAQPIAEVTEATWQESISINLTGVWFSMQQEILYMQDHGGGIIVNNASSIGMHARRPLLGVYAATKAAVCVLSRTAAREYIDAGIRINVISPGAIDTAMSHRTAETEAERVQRYRSSVPIGRSGTAQEVAAAVLWLASSESSFVVGHDLVLDGGDSA